MIKKIASLLILWKLFLFFLAYIASLFIPLFTEFIPKEEFRSYLSSWIWMWGNFDGQHYLYIAKHGYGFLENPFFPLYPLLIHIVTTLSGIPYLISGQIISHSAFLLSIIVIYKILCIDKRRNLLFIFLFVVLLIPTSFFYGTVYNDSLFLLFACLCILFARKKQFMLSGLSGAIATLTRLNGLALFFFIIFEYLSSNGMNYKKTWSIPQMRHNFVKLFTLRSITESKIYFILFIPLAFLGYLLYTQVVHDDWSLVFSSMEVWNQDKITFPPQVFWRYFKILFLYPTFKLNYYVAIFELFMILFYLFITYVSIKKIRFSYWIFIVISLLIPSLTGTFAGMPRYILHLYPLFLAITLFLNGRGNVTKFVYFLISTLLLFPSIALFTRGYFVT